MVLVHVHRFPNKQTKPPTHNPPQTKSPIPRAICPNETNHPLVIHPNETVGAVPACPPERPRSGVSIPTNTRIVCGELNDGCALAGRHGRRPYQSPSYFSTQSHTNQITIYMQSTQTKSTVHVQSETSAKLFL